MRAPNSKNLFLPSHPSAHCSSARYSPVASADGAAAPNMCDEKPHLTGGRTIAITLASNNYKDGAGTPFLQKGNRKAALKAAKPCGCQQNVGMGTGSFKVAGDDLTKICPGQIRITASYLRRLRHPYCRCRTSWSPPTSGKSGSGSPGTLEWSSESSTAHTTAHRHKRSDPRSTSR